FFFFFCEEKFYDCIHNSAKKATSHKGSIQISHKRAITITEQSNIKIKTIW
ncbi:unnamed protein product, partial [Prunus brigantina]